MDLGLAFRRAWSIVQLDRPVLRDVARDPGATWPGVVLLAIAGAVGAWFHPFVILPAAVIAVAWGFAWIGVLHVVAMLFGGKGGYVPLWNALSHGRGLVSMAGIVPFLGHLVAFVWGLVIDVVAVEEVHGLPRERAIVVVLVPLLLSLLCLCGTVLMFGAALGGALLPRLH